MGETDNKVTEERVESASDFPHKPQLEEGDFKANVQLADGDVTYLIPTPSSDPRGMTSSWFFMSYVHALARRS
ncbi:hypothetical protein ColLi_00260 [Colletotrichum liriopes]|uniref:Uncharacterized protein n=1 Tax=Colletotrichum liriopes TaxID=708192 RepID=A0AA37GB51_9PEZI|nr:hypothetical protein ColLi_00260 [Colletotrichum liriopes]